MTNWQTMKLGDLAKIGDGLHSTPKYVTSSDFYFINGNNLSGGGVTITKNTKMVSESEYIKHRKNINESTVLLSINGTIGNAAYYKGEKVVLGKSVAYINCQNYIQRQFLFALLSSNIVRNYFMGELTGSTIKNLSLKTIRDTPIKLPLKPEQQRIVAVLETWDEYLNLLDQKIALKEQLKKSLMQQLLTAKRRLPEFTGEWSSPLIGDLVNVKKGSGLSKEKITNTGASCILYGEIYTKYDEIIDTIFSKTQSNEGLPSQKGDVLIPASTTTSNLDVATATVVNENAVRLGGDINVLRPKIDINSGFLAVSLSTTEKHALAKKAQGVTIIHLYGKDVVKVKIDLPPINEQNAIMKIYMSMRTELADLKKKQSQLTNQKKYLLKNLITGTIRTPDNLHIKGAN